MEAGVVDQDDEVVAVRARKSRLQRAQQPGSARESCSTTSTRPKAAKPSIGKQHRRAAASAMRGPPNASIAASGSRARSARTTAAPWRSPEGSPADTKMRGAWRRVMPRRARRAASSHGGGDPKRQRQRRPALLAAHHRLALAPHRVDEARAVRARARRPRGPRARSAPRRPSRAPAGAGPPAVPEPHEVAAARWPGRATGSRSAWNIRSRRTRSRADPRRRHVGDRAARRTRPARWPDRGAARAPRRPRRARRWPPPPPVRCRTRSRSWIIRSSTTATSVPRGWNGARRWLSRYSGWSQQRLRRAERAVEALDVPHLQLHVRAAPPRRSARPPPRVWRRAASPSAPGRPRRSARKPTSWCELRRHGHGHGAHAGPAVRPGRRRRGSPTSAATSRRARAVDVEHPHQRRLRRAAQGGARDAGRARPRRSRRSGAPGSRRDAARRTTPRTSRNRSTSGERRQVARAPARWRLRQVEVGVEERAGRPA